MFTLNFLQFFGTTLVFRVSFVDEKSHKSPQVNMERRLTFAFLQFFLMFTSLFYLFHHRVILQ
jgi:hypothetical protein